MLELEWVFGRFGSGGVLFAGCQRAEGAVRVRGFHVVVLNRALTSGFRWVDPLRVVRLEMVLTRKSCSAYSNTI